MYVCRAAAGDCDIAETCTGSSASCPSDGYKAIGTICRVANGVCDIAETCDGSSAACPTDSYRPSTYVCRAAAGDCDVAEYCTGTNVDCPADDFAAAGTTCRAAAGDCDVPEFCDGSSATCPVDIFQPLGTVCRAAAGDCDVVETCDGISAACPADTFIAAGTVCRAAAGNCDITETCSGTSAACPADAFIAAGTVCRAAAGDCDLEETCIGTSVDCPADEYQPDGTACDDGDPNTYNDACQAGVCVGTTTGTILVTVKLIDHNGDPLDTGFVIYQAKCPKKWWRWKIFGFTSGGEVSKELEPGVYTFVMIYEGNSQRMKHIDIEENPVITFQTVLLIVRLVDKNGNPVDDGLVKYRAIGLWRFLGWKTFGTTIGGEVSKELLPGKYSIKMIYEGCTFQVNNIDITKIPIITFQLGRDHKCCGRGWKYILRIWGCHKHHRWKSKAICYGCWK